MELDEVPSCSGTSKQSMDDSMLSQARDAFERGDYQDCLRLLDKLEATVGSNQRIRHNKAIAEFYISGCKNFNDLLLKLENLTPPEENKEEPTTFSARYVSLSPVARYNISLIYFYKQKYNSAFSILSPLIHKLFDFDEETSVAVGILMVNILLKRNQINRAKGLLDFMHAQLKLQNERSFPAEGGASKTIVSAEIIQELKCMSLLTQVLRKENVVVPADGTLEEALLKAHQFYLLNDFQMASKQLLKICRNSYPPETRKDLDTCIANNMGIIHLRVRHYAIAAMFFQNAIAFDRKMVNNLQMAPLHQLGSIRIVEILYNLGIAMLHLKRPKEAFQCFLVPLEKYHSNPRLWLRLAEACIMNFEMNLSERQKRIITPPASYSERDRKHNPDSTKTSKQEPSLEYAVLCLRSSLTIVNFYKSQITTITNNDNSEEENESWHNIKDSNFCSPSMPVSKESFDSMQSAIYAAYSYVSLRIGDYVTAYEAALELLRVENVSDAYRMLAHMYLGQAFTLMERFADARRYFDPSLLSTFNSSDFETKNWKVKSLDAAQAIARYNMVVVMLLQGEYEAAGNLLRTCTHPIVASNVMGLKSYLDRGAVSGE